MENCSKLTEPGVRYFLCEVLKQCREKKYALYSKLFNTIIFILFLLLIGGILYYKHKGKITEVEKKVKRKREEMYILEKIKSLQPGQKEKREQNLIITELPQLDSGFDVLHKNYYSI